MSGAEASLERDRAQSMAERRERMQLGLAIAAVIAVVAGVLVTTQVHWGQGQPPAPPTSALPLPPGARVVASAAGGSDISTSIPGRWRYMAVAGPTTMRSRRLLISVARFLIARGWMDPEAFVVRYGSPSTEVVPLAMPGATVLIDSPTRRFYVSLSTVTSQVDADQSTEGSPLYGSSAIRRAIEDREPVLDVTLGNGTHGQPAS